MAFCTTCGMQLQIGERCPSCQTIVISFTEAHFPSAPTIVRPAAPKKAPDDGWLVPILQAMMIFTALCIVAVVIGGGLAVYTIAPLQEPRDETRPAQIYQTEPPRQRQERQVEIPPPTPVPVTAQSILDDTFPVAALQWRSFGFVVDRQVRLKGRFSAAGGQNDINCVIVDDDNLENIRNNTGFYSYFHSGYISRGKVDLTLAPGRYHIVFDNQKALLTPKAVSAEFSIE